MALEEAFEAAVGSAHFWLDAEAEGVASQRTQVSGRVTGGVEGRFDGGDGFGHAFWALRVVAEDGSGDDPGFKRLEVGINFAVGRFDSVTPPHAGQEPGGAEVFIKMNERPMDGAFGPGGVGVRSGDSSDEARGLVADAPFVKGAGEMRELAELAGELALGPLNAARKAMTDRARARRVPGGQRIARGPLPWSTLPA